MTHPGGHRRRTRSHQVREAREARRSEPPQKPTASCDSDDDVEVAVPRKGN